MVTQQAIRNPQSAIELHIEELILHGFAPGDRARIGAALEGELARLLAERGLPEGLAQGGTIDQLDGGSCEVARGAAPEAVGAQLAHAVYGGLSR